MKTNNPTLADHLGGSYTDEMVHYQAILREMQADLNAYPAPLRADAQSFFDFLAPGEFSQVVALLPYWLADLAPVTPEICHQLGLAHLYGWWYYAAQDELLDGDASTTVMLAGHLALLKMVAKYREMGVTEASVWAEWDRLAQLSAASYSVEMQSRFITLAELTLDKLQCWTIELIINRAAPFYFNSLAQIYLSGILYPGIPASPDSLYSILPTAISYFGASRQISDDANDWLDDLKNGQLNYVSAQLILHLYEADSMLNTQALDIDRLSGRQLMAESFWDAIERNAQSLAQQALDLLQPYSPCKLETLIAYQMQRNVASWASARKSRAALREVFGLTDRY